MSMYKDKIAIITGAGSGIGRGLGEEMARRGSHVVVSDVSSERIDETREAIEKAGGKVSALTLDVCDYGAVKKMVDDTVAEHGRIDYIFNNAGIATGGEARDITIEDWHEVLDVNLNGVINGVATAYPIMAKQGFGHVVNTASVEGLIPFPGTIAYVASKYAVVGLSNTLRLEGKSLGVKVSVVCPGHIKTKIFHDAKMVNLDREKAIGPMTNAPGLTSDQCALVILSGVEKNKAIIPVTAFAHIIWRLARISPGFVFWLMGKFGEAIKGARLEDK